MELSIFLAKFLGLYCILIAIVMFINAKQFRAFILNVFNSPAIIFFSGILALLFGLLIVLAHNVWEGWPIIITLIGWLALIKGIALLCFSNWYVKYIKSFAEGKSFYAVVIINLILGLVLLYFGFIF